jgi:asparagine synthetase B (glutamine-hydrolysing)
MLDTFFRVSDFYWNGDRFRPRLDLNQAMALEALAELQGQFSIAAVLPSDDVVLARDKLGINKLFLAIHESGRLVVANYLADLVEHGAPLEAIYSVPAGHLMTLDPQRRRLTLQRYFTPLAKAHAGAGIEEIARAIRGKLEVWFERLAAALDGRDVCICLSGGLDSSLIAALAARHFIRVTAYSYGFCEGGRMLSEDAEHAAAVAEYLGIPFRLVPASADDVLSALDEAVCYGQDWRDFNVHCAVVNTMLARAIAQNAGDATGTRRPVVLSGDLMNEFLADYSPVSYDGREYYSLPRLQQGRLRLALVRGLDAGDREVGVFNHHGIDVIQPYGLVVDDYLQLPDAFLASDQCKPALVRAIAGDLLPPSVFARRKVRAQIGTSGEPTGILPVLVKARRDAQWLRDAFCRRFVVNDASFLDRFVRLGVYRFPTEYPHQSGVVHGYLA